MAKLVPGRLGVRDVDGPVDLGVVGGQLGDDLTVGVVAVKAELNDLALQLPAASCEVFDRARRRIGHLRRRGAAPDCCRPGRRRSPDGSRPERLCPPCAPPLRPAPDASSPRPGAPEPDWHPRSARLRRLRGLGMSRGAVRAWASSSRRLFGCDKPRLAAGSSERGPCGLPSARAHPGWACGPGRPVHR